VPQFEEISLRESGGLTGLTRLFNIERSDTSKEDRERLDHAIEALGFFDLAAPVPKGVISDAELYDLKVTRKGTAYSIHIERPPNISEAVLKLLTIIREIGATPTA
jgi:hypothetical protein